jgi:hypothetical protein
MAPASPSPPIAAAISPPSRAARASSRACSIDVVRSTRKAMPCERSAASTSGSNRAARPAPAEGLTIRRTGRSIARGG